MSQQYTNLSINETTESKTNEMKCQFCNEIKHIRKDHRICDECKLIIKAAAKNELTDDYIKDNNILITRGETVTIVGLKESDVAYFFFKKSKSNGNQETNEQ